MIIIIIIIIIIPVWTGLKAQMHAVDLVSDYPLVTA